MKSVICMCLYFLLTSAVTQDSIPEKINLLFNTNSKLILLIPS